MKPEPLKPKPVKKNGVWCWELEDGELITMTGTEECILEWLEERVQGLLEEIEKEIEKLSEDEAVCGLEIAKQKIKKWFGDVL